MAVVTWAGALEAAKPQARHAGVPAAGRRRPDAPRGLGPGRALLPLDELGRRAGPIASSICGLTAIGPLGWVATDFIVDRQPAVLADVDAGPGRRAAAHALGHRRDLGAARSAARHRQDAGVLRRARRPRDRDLALPDSQRDPADPVRHRRVHVPGDRARRAVGDPALPAGAVGDAVAVRGGAARRLHDAAARRAQPRRSGPGARWRWSLLGARLHGHQSAAALPRQQRAGVPRRVAPQPARPAATSPQVKDTLAVRPGVGTDSQADSGRALGARPAREQGAGALRRLAQACRRRTRYGLALFPVGRTNVLRTGFAVSTDSITQVPAPGFKRIATDRYFAAYRRCPPARG